VNDVDVRDRKSITKDARQKYSSNAVSWWDGNTLDNGSDLVARYYGFKNVIKILQHLTDDAQFGLYIHVPIDCNLAPAGAHPRYIFLPSLRDDQVAVIMLFGCCSRPKHSRYWSNTFSQNGICYLCKVFDQLYNWLDDMSSTCKQPRADKGLMWSKRTTQEFDRCWGENRAEMIHDEDNQLTTSCGQRRDQKHTLNEVGWS